MRTAGETTVLVVVGPDSREQACDRLGKAGCEVLQIDNNSPAERLERLLELLSQRGMTNVLVEGGGRLLGSLFDTRNIDECHVFIAPKLVGGAGAPSPIRGGGVGLMSDALVLKDVTVQSCGVDAHVHGLVAK